MLLSLMVYVTAVSFLLATAAWTCERAVRGIAGHPLDLGGRTRRHTGVHHPCSPTPVDSGNPCGGARSEHLGAPDRRVGDVPYRRAIEIGCDYRVLYGATLACWWTSVLGERTHPPGASRSRTPLHSSKRESEP